MVRIVGEEKKQEVPVLEKFGPAEEILLQVVGTIIAERPEDIRNLLEDFSVDLNETSTEQELTNALLDAIAENNQEFNDELATLILNYTLQSEYDSFDFKSLFKKGGDSQDEQSGSGGGLIAGIAGAIGKIGDGIKGRLNRDQASSQTLQGIYAYKTQLSATEQSKTKSKRNMLIAIVFLFGLSFLAMMAYMNKKSDTTIPLKT